MITRRSLLAALAPIGALALGGCNSRTRSFRYRVTVDVDTPEGVKRGTCVQEVSVGFNDGVLKGLGNAIFVGIRGEALVVDLADRGLLFILMTADPTRKASRTFFGAFEGAHQDLRDPDGLSPGMMDRLAALKSADEIPAANLPALVRFRDTGDPKTVERIDPMDLATAFGLSVRIARAAIAVTDDPVTTGIAKRLPWLAASRAAGMLDGRRYHESNDLANTLTANAFEALSH